MSLYWPLPDARRNPFSSRKRVSGRLLPGKQAAKHGGLSGHMRILDTRLCEICGSIPGTCHPTPVTCRPARTVR